VAKKIVTLYVDDASLRLLVIQGQRVKKWAELPLEPGLVKSNVVVKVNEVALKVKQLLKSQKVHAKKVIIGLSGLHCLTRPVVLPELPREMLAEAVVREAKRVLPMLPEQLYLSWQTLPAQKGETRLFMVAVPRRIADALLGMLHRAGLKPRLMDLKPLALARIVWETTAVIVDVQPTEFDIVIMADKVPQPIRTIPFPSEELSGQDKLLMIRNELSRTIEFYNSNNKEKPLAPDVPAFFSGELVDEPGLWQVLSNELGRPVLPLSSPLRHSEQLSSRYLVNIGLALKELEEMAGPSLANVNSLPVDYRPKPISLVRIVVLPSAVVVLASLVLLSFVVQDTSANIDSLQSRLNYANQFLAQRALQKARLEKDIAELEKKLTETQGSLDTYTVALGTIETQGRQINGDLNITVSKLSEAMSLVGINHENSELTIQGRATDEAEVLSYARRLENSGRFFEVIVAKVSRLEDGTLDFTLLLRLRGS